MTLCAGAQRDIVTSSCLDDSADRGDNDLRLVDRDNVTGSLSGDQTASF